MNEPEFYVGYQPRMPGALSRVVQRIIVGLTLVTLGIAALLVAGQSPFAATRFDFLNYRAYEGTVYEWPYPMLATGDGHYLLVGAGKHGGEAAVRGFDGKTVHLRGKLVERGANRMLEIEAGSIQATQSPVVHSPPMSFGFLTLHGEIVDTKCHFGVMNPGEGKVHRDCAARCISGGIPPGFLVRDADGASRVLLLVGADGRKLNHEIHDYVAEPLHIQGELVRSNSAWVFKVEPSRFQRD